MNMLFRDLEGSVRCPFGSVVCIGAFDGLHLGHQALINHACVRARMSSVPAVALSFEPLPREFFSMEMTPRLLWPRAKFEGLCALGVDQVGLLRFNQALASMTPEDFVETVLVRRLAAREVWVGPDFCFGKARSGDITTLRRLGERYGFTVGEIPPVLIAGERVSSSRLRLQLAAGDFEAAALGFGRRYMIAGKVVRGAQLGRKLGYPTANLRLGGKHPALSGIYATWVHGIGDSPRASVSSLGRRPTVADGGELVLEAHVFDFEGDLYRRRIAVEFVAKLRDEEKFDDLSALIDQINLDAERARRVLQDDTEELRLEELRLSA